MESTRRQKINLYFLFVVRTLITCLLCLTTAQAASPQAFQNGDLVLRRGEGFFSDIARNFSPNDKRFSHVGIIVTHQQQSHVVHSIHELDKGLDGVVIETLDAFLTEATDWAIYRLNINKNQQQDFANTALRYSNKHIPFDSHFDLSSSKAMYCTEFVWRVSKESIHPNPIKPAVNIGDNLFISIEDIYAHDNISLIESSFVNHERN